MGAIITIALILIVGFILLGKSGKIGDVLESEGASRGWGKFAAWLVLGIGAAVIVFSSITTVPTKNMGVTDAFGRPVRTLDNGLQLTFPWEKVTTYDATIQTDEWDLEVRIANNAVAVMKPTVHWRLDERVDITSIHKDWREFGRLKDNVVKPRLQNVLNQTFETYDPLMSLKENGGKTVLVSTFEGRVKQALQEIVPSGILIDLVLLPKIKLPDNVEKSLAAYQEALASTQVAQQSILTADAQREAADKLAAAKVTKESLMLACLTLTERIYQSGKVPNAMWTCIGSNAGAALALQ